MPGEERGDLLLRSGRLVFLQTVGYTEAEISSLGDLAAVPSEKISELLHSKAEDAIAKALVKSVKRYHPKVRKIGRKKKE